MNRRTLLALAGLALALVPCAATPAVAQSTPKIETLRADLAGPRGSGGVVQLQVQGRERRLEVEVWGIPARAARVVLGDRSYPLIMSPLTGSGRLAFDSRRGQRVPALKAGSVVAVTVEERTWMKGVLVPVP